MPVCLSVVCIKLLVQIYVARKVIPCLYYYYVYAHLQCDFESATDSHSCAVAVHWE